MDESLIMEVWDMFVEYIPEKSKDTAANQYVDFLLGKDISVDVLEGFLGYDPHLDTAIQVVVDEASEYDDEDEYDEGYDEDEDY